MDLFQLTKRAMVQMFSVGGATQPLTLAGSAPMRSLSSECTAIINAMRGKTDNKKRWQIAVLKDEVPAGKVLEPGLSVTLGQYAGTIEEDDFVDDSGVLSFFIS